MSATHAARRTERTGRQPADTQAPGRAGSAAAGVLLGVLAGALARSLSTSYGQQESSALRATAHATVPFLVAASVLTDRVGARAAVPFRGGFVGAHLMHARQIARLVRDGGSDGVLIRAELAGGSLLYGLVVLQVAALSAGEQTMIGMVEAERLTRRPDTLLMRVYCLAIAAGVARHRRPLPVYAGLGTLLAGGLTSRKRHP
jgi:hypothetical protein